ncbi:MAG: amidase domain-containing protein [Clostridiales bacterium]|jgi:hypothetical protein|nr:amidase domain-containing protein [Clostridiales bacterium]
MPGAPTGYNRENAVGYAHKWAYARNPSYYDYEKLGGDCTNFASQCIFAGAGVMNRRKTGGWYYNNANDKSPSWTGVEFLANFLLRKNKGLGPFAEEVGIQEVMPGDIVQLSFNGANFQHTPVVVKTGRLPRPENILIAAHSINCDNRPLNTYIYKRIRCLHITGVRK